MSDDLFEEAVKTNLDATLQRAQSDGSPVASSGISGGSKASHPSTEPSPAVPAVAVTSGGAGGNCAKCGKVLKTKKGFENHMFLHNIADVNLKKPTEEVVLACVSSFLSDILSEISKEPRVPLEKKDLVEEMKRSEGSDNWNHFCLSIASPLVQALLERSKTLPSNQYEELLTKVNIYLNQEENISELQLKTNMLLSSQELVDSRFIRNVLSKIMFRLCEELQIFVAQEMKEKKSVVKERVQIFASDSEKDSFGIQIERLLRTYYKRASGFKSPLFNARCLCLRRNFVTCGDNEFITSEMVLDQKMWDDNTLKVSETAIKFFTNVEYFIKLSMKEKDIACTDLVSKICCQFDQSVLNGWHRLTTGYLSEADSLIFMKEIVSILTDLSTKLEGKRIKRTEEEKKMLQKFGVRTNLKRN